MDLVALKRMDNLTKREKYLIILFHIKVRFKVVVKFCLYLIFIKESHISEELFLMSRKKVTVVINLLSKYSFIICKKNA